MKTIITALVIFIVMNLLPVAYIKWWEYLVGKTADSDAYLILIFICAVVSFALVTLYIVETKENKS